MFIFPTAIQNRLSRFKLSGTVTKAGWEEDWGRPGGRLQPSGAVTDASRQQEPPEQQGGSRAGPCSAAGGTFWKSLTKL